MRIQHEGALLDPEGFQINDGPEGGGRPVVAFDGDNFVVVWEHGSGISGVRVEPDGDVLGPVFTVVSSDEVGSPAIACISGRCLVAFSIEGDAELVVGLRRLTAGREVEIAQSLGLGGGFAFDPSLAASEEGFLVVWSDSRGGASSQDIYGARVTSEGTLSGPRGGFLISGAQGAQRNPDVLWTGRRFLTVWQDDRWATFDIWGARVTGSGTVEDPSGFRISPAGAGGVDPAVAHLGSSALVVWAGLSSAHVAGARVSEEAEIRDPGAFSISSGAHGANLLPDVAAGGARFVSVYLAGTAADAPPFHVVGSRISPEAVVLDEQVLTRSRN